MSDRDFILETLAAATICAMHLSRFAEEMVIWSSAQFGFVRLSDRFTTGSSIMPQKRNPDAAELVRAKVGRVVGALTACWWYEGPAARLFQGHAGGQGSGLRRARRLSLSLAAMTGMVDDLDPNSERMPQRGAGILDRHRYRRLAGAQAEPPVPRRARYHRAAG